MGLKVGDGMGKVSYVIGTSWEVMGKVRKVSDVMGKVSDAMGKVSDAMGKVSKYTDGLTFFLRVDFVARGISLFHFRGISLFHFKPIVYSPRTIS